MAGNLITSLLSLITTLLPSIRASSPYYNNLKKGRAVEEDLESLMQTLVRIKATLYDAEEMEITDLSVKLWLKELKQVANDAQNVLSEYSYEVRCLQVQARKASQTSGSHKRKRMEYVIPIPDGMVNRLKKIRSQFDEIAKDREALQLRDSDGVRSPNNNRPQTGHMVDEASIFGRDAEKKGVIDFILFEKEKSLSVISIVGKGGLGKTTIAQLVYKDLRNSRCFDLFGWVCVSKKFDVIRLTKATIESITKISCGLSELSPLQDELAEIVKEKTLLLVLDNVWNKKQSLWELFQLPFKEAKMVRILVTTRNENVAAVMQTTAYFRPTNLSEDLCWQLFQHYAFSGTSNAVSPHLVDIGREIVRKCDGLPLSVKSIASQLKFETDEEGWREILESDLWESNPVNDILPALQISYAHLPAHLRPYFLYCSMFPKNYRFEKDLLIKLWMASGFIQSNSNRRITEIGAEYYEELKERSFFDEFSDQEFSLHDMIHDLARHISMVDINQPLDIQEGNISRDTYHLYERGFMGYVYQIVQQKLKGLRTLSTVLLGTCNLRWWQRNDT